MKISSQINTQSAEAAAAIEDLLNQIGDAGAATQSSNPAADEYAAGVQSSDADAAEPQSYNEALAQVERELVTKEFHTQEIERILADLEYYLENADLTNEQRSAVREAIINGRVLQTQTERELGGLQQTRDSMLTFGSEADWDGDGLTNAWEFANNSNAGSVDTDGDGLNDAVERALNASGVDSHWNMADSDSNGVTDYVQNYEFAAEAADALGIDNWDLGPRGGGSSVGSYSSDDPGSDGGSSDSVSGSDGDTPPPPEYGPEPGEGAIEVDTSSADTSETAETADADTQSMGTQSVDESSEESGSMGIQTDDGDEPVEELSKDEIRELLENKTYTADQIETITTEDGWDASGETLADVVINLSAGNDNVLITQEGTNLIILTEDKKIIIESFNGRKIFINDMGGIDSINLVNVDQKLIVGATQIIDGNHEWASGLFIQRNEGNGYNPIGDNAASDTVTDDGVEGTTWGFDYQTTATDDEPEAAPVQNVGVENVYVDWDIFRDGDGNVSDAVEYIGKDIITDDHGTNYLEETYELNGDMGTNVEYFIPETINGKPVYRVIVEETNSGQDMVLIFEDKTGKKLRKIIIKNGITNGNTLAVDANDPRIRVIMPNGLHSPKDYYENGYSFKAVELDFSAVSGNFAYIKGGSGDDMIHGSGFVGIDGEQYDHIFGGDGNDIISLGGGAYVEAGDGSDVVTGGSGDDIIYGGRGHDLIDGGTGSNFLYGEAGDDFLVVDHKDGEHNFIDGGQDTNMTNQWSSRDGITLENIQNDLDNIEAGGISELVEMLDVGAEEAQEALDMIHEWLKADARDLASDKIYKMFGDMIGIRKESFGMDGAPTSPDYSSDEEEIPGDEGADA